MYRITMTCILFFAMMTQSMGEELTCPVTSPPSFITPASNKNTKISLDDVKSLTFVQGEMTTSQRTTQIPQVTCYGKNCYMAPKEITLSDIYRSITPFLLVMLFALILVMAFPQIATYLPDKYLSN